MDRKRIQKRETLRIKRKYTYKLIRTRKFYKALDENEMKEPARK
jgi:hypothetical protein